MGYYIQLQNVNFLIKAADVPKALKAIQDLRGKETISDGSGRHFSWVRHDFYEIDNFEQMMEAWRYPVEFEENGDVGWLTFEGEKLGDEDKLFGAIAPFVAEGSYIEWSGEDGARWRYVFSNGTFKEIFASVVWED